MSSTGYIGPNGKYIKTKNAKKLADDVSSTYKDWSHTKQRNEHRADLVPPYKNGKLNPEFQQLYPEESRKYSG